MTVFYLSFLCVCFILNSKSLFLAIENNLIDNEIEVVYNEQKMCNNVIATISLSLSLLIRISKFLFPAHLRFTSRSCSA